MRARRLRHLGLISGDSSMTATSSGSEESDDAQHKQKQQRIDNESDLEVVLNNNDPLETDTKLASNCLTQRSRLLNDIEKQQLENRINQNDKDTGIMMADTNSSSEICDMETDENHEINKKFDDTASIENMETDDIVQQPIETTIKPTDRPVSDELKELEAEICLSRILDAFWADHCEGNIILTDTAAFYKEMADEGNTMHFNDLICQIITEVIDKYFNGDCIGVKMSANYSAYEKELLAAMDTKDESTDTESSPSTAGSNCSIPKLMPHNLPTHAAVTHLIHAFNRCAHEQDRYNSTRNRNKFESIILNAIAAIRKQLVSTTILLLDGTIVKNEDVPMFQQCRSVLLTLLIENEVPSDFFNLLFYESYQKFESFKIIFERLLINLFLDMQCRVIAKTIDMAPINLLRQLTEMTVDRARPICDLITSLSNFNPNVCSGIEGRQIVKCSFLGPFLSLSVFSEENPKLAEDANEDWEVAFGETIRLQLDHMRGQMHGVFHSLLRSTENRNQVLNYLSKIINSNEKRTQFHAEDKKLARDGFMLNVMSVLQKLSLKIKLDRIDPNYPFNDKSLITIEKDTKLRFDETEYKNWISSASKF